MICYHGGPITPEPAALATWRNAHAMISFANKDQDALAFGCAESVALDNGAWTTFAAGQGAIDVEAYAEWVNRWYCHPAFDWCLIPDKIDGTEEENDSYIEEWPFPPSISVPIWHLHESLAKLEWLTEAWPRIAFGSSGEWIDIGTTRWWGRISEAMEVAADKDGHPKVKLHGLRQMGPEVFSIIPYASVDSTNVARNIGIDKAWTGSYIPRRRETRAMFLLHFWVRLMRRRIGQLNWRHLTWSEFFFHFDFFFNFFFRLGHGMSTALHTSER
jgi:hypothetical protein